MYVQRDELEKTFREIGDEQLLARIAGGDLTELALDVAIVEAAARGLQVPRREAPPDDTNELFAALGPLRICERFLLPLDAQVFAARLREDGLAARVMDADTVYANGAFPYSLALGGVRVMVPESQLADAMRIRAALNAGEYAIDEQFDPGDEERR
jgi:hypothetical protein